MANIQVDHRYLEKVANSIDDYVKLQKQKMREIENTIADLNGSWDGTDYEQVKYEFQQSNSAESTSAKMIKSIENYADFLRFCSNKYKSAQINAINRANRLPRY